MLSGPNFLTTLSANVTANLVRNVWSNIIIFCGHFPDGAEKFTEEQLDNESKAEWYLRQLLGSANFEGGRFLHIMSGSLGYQIEHHLFPDLPSNRYPEIADARAGTVREVRHSVHHGSALPTVRTDVAHALTTQPSDEFGHTRARLARAPPAEFG